MTEVFVYDIENYPENYKSVEVKLMTAVPLGEEGDEKWLISCSTSAYSDNTARTTINNVYMSNYKFGWIKSSGLVGVGGKFTLVSGVNYQLGVKINVSAGDPTYSGYYKIELDPGINLHGEDIAEDIEAKIKALPESASWNSADDPVSVGYLNCKVTYEGGKFWIISGTAGKFSGSNRSSVLISKIGTDTCYETLGFNLAMSSEAIDELEIKETLLSSNYTADSSTLTVATDLAVYAGNSMFITDGTYADYFTVISGSGTTIYVATQANNNFTGITHNYTANVTKVQKLRWQDPDNDPGSYYETIDDVVRFGIDSLVNQIDFSS
jgi:hypothetical protein